MSIKIFGGAGSLGYFDRVNKNGSKVATNIGAVIGLTKKTTIYGEGWVKAIQHKYQTIEFDYVALKVDGVWVLGSATSGVLLMQRTMLPLMIKFNSYVELWGYSTNEASLRYSLGKKITDGKLLAFNVSTGSQTKTRTINILGKGYITSYSTGGDCGYLVVDGVMVENTVNDKMGENITFMRFESQLELYVTTTQIGYISYVLD